MTSLTLLQIILSCLSKWSLNGLIVVTAC